MLMQAMVLESRGAPLVLRTLNVPRPAPGQVLVRVEACGVCRTDLHILDGDLAKPKLPLIMGHEIVGSVVECGEGVTGFVRGERVGLPWLGRSCGVCHYCTSRHENLCEAPAFTGYDLDGGYAGYTVADHRYCLHLPDSCDGAGAAPLLCAGLIGYRSYRLAGEAQALGLYGFGAAAHILVQIANSQGRRVHAFTRPGDEEGQTFARRLGAVWAGGSGELPPEPLDAAIIFAPVGALVPLALRAVRKGGAVVCAGIHMTNIPSFAYELLWGERIVRSVANLTRDDGRAFFDLIARTPVETTVETFPLTAANEALERLRSGKVQGAAVLVMDPA
jgi:propanol-preferring alcohol dehydrogenase